MLVVVAHLYDVSAQWAAERLRARSGRRVELVLVEALGGADMGWRQELGDGGVRTVIRLADGPRLETGKVTAVLNRMLEPPVAMLAAAVDGDDAYARSELTSFAVSWMRGLAPVVVNQPTPQGLSGRWRAPLAWRSLALEAGLEAEPGVFDSRDPPPQPSFAEPNGEPTTTVLTIGGRMLMSAVPREVRSAARRLVKLAETPILGLRFAGADPRREGWRLLDANPHPDLSLAGETGIAALEKQLAA